MSSLLCRTEKVTNKKNSTQRAEGRAVLHCMVDDIGTPHLNSRTMSAEKSAYYPDSPHVNLSLLKLNKSTQIYLDWITVLVEHSKRRRNVTWERSRKAKEMPMLETSPSPRPVPWPTPTQAHQNSADLWEVLPRLLFKPVCYWRKQLTSLLELKCRRAAIPPKPTANYDCTPSALSLFNSSWLFF